MQVSKALEVHNREKNKAKLSEEKRGVRGIDKDKGGAQCSLEKKRKWGESLKGGSNMGAEKNANKVS